MQVQDVPSERGARLVGRAPPTRSAARPDAAADGVEAGSHRNYLPLAARSPEAEEAEDVKDDKVEVHRREKM